MTVRHAQSPVTWSAASAANISRGRLDGLLVEAGPRTRRAATSRCRSGDRCPSGVVWAAMSQSSAPMPAWIISASAVVLAGHDEGTMRQPVLIGHHRLGPRPVEPTVGSNAFHNRSAMSPNVSVHGAGGATTDGSLTAERDGRDGAQCADVTGRRQGPFEQRLRGRSERRIRGGRHGIAQRVHGTSLTVLGRSFVQPRAVHASEVAEAPGRASKLRTGIAGSAARSPRQAPSPAAAHAAGRPGARGRHRPRSSHGPDPGVTPAACCMIPTWSVRFSRWVAVDGVEVHLRHRRPPAAGQRPTDGATPATRSNTRR